MQPAPADLTQSRRDDAWQRYSIASKTDGAPAHDRRPISLVRPRSSVVRSRVRTLAADYPSVPELPDIVAYIHALEPRVVGKTLQRVCLSTPFLLRTVDPPLREAEGKRVAGVRRLGKRVVFEHEDDLFLVIHLMIAGRLHWKPAGAKPPGKVGLAAFDFESGTLLLTEAGTKRRASLPLLRGRRRCKRWTVAGAASGRSSSPASCDLAAVAN